MTLNPGVVLGNRYRIVRLLGQGGFGSVYRAWDILMQGPCAVKENLDTSDAVKDQFEREARLLFQLRHPGLPRVFDQLTIPDQGQYLIMDYIEGEDLDDILVRQAAPLPEAQALAWISKVSQALNYLHTRQPPIIHRDVKPANILITPDQQVYLVDFGIAKVFEPNRATSTGARALTAGYAPPEQYSSGQTDASSDIYALGATLYHLLTNKKPSDSLDLLFKSVPPLKPVHELNPAVSQPVSLAIHRAMELEKSARYQSVREFEAALLSGPAAFQRISADAASPARAPSAAKPALLPSTALQDAQPVPQQKAPLAAPAVTPAAGPSTSPATAASTRLAGAGAAPLPAPLRRTGFSCVAIGFAIAAALVTISLAIFYLNTLGVFTPPSATPTPVEEGGLPATPTAPPANTAILGTETGIAAPLIPTQPAAPTEAAASPGVTPPYGSAGIIFFDDFSNNDQHWETGQVDDEDWNGVYEIIGGVYRIKGVAKRGTSFWALAPLQPDGSPYLVSTTMHQVSGSGRSSMGLVFNLLPRADGFYTYFNFLINEQSQTYNLSRSTATGWEELTEWIRTNAIDPARPNRVSVLVQEDRAKFYINDQYMTEFVQDGLTVGRVGFLMSIYETNGAGEFTFDDFTLRRP